MNEPTPAPAIDAAPALRAAPPAPEEVVPVSVPAPSGPPPAPPALVAPVVPAAPASTSSLDDQLPTSRLPSLPLELPPPVAPHGPAHKTQPLRPITRDAAEARLVAEAKQAKRRRWMAVVAHMKRAAVAVPSSLVKLRASAWTERRVGVACAALGLAMIAGALVLGWQGVTSDRLEKAEHVSVAVAVVVSRAALAIAAMFVGFGLLRVGERTLGRGHADKTLRRDAL